AHWMSHRPDGYPDRSLRAARIRPTHGRLAGIQLPHDVGREPFVELTGKGVAIGRRERRRPADLLAAGAHRLHEVAHGENTTDGVRRIALTARIERAGSLGNDVR